MGKTKIKESIAVKKYMYKTKGRDTYYIGANSMYSVADWNGKETLLQLRHDQSSPRFHAGTMFFNAHFQIHQVRILNISGNWKWERSYLNFAVLQNEAFGIII